MILLIDSLTSRLCLCRAMPKKAGASSGGRCDRSSQGLPFEEVSA
jgi:hypothetical protein